MDIEKISEFEQLQAQLQSIYMELGALSKKKPDDAVNVFKLNIINAILEKANVILGDESRPFDNFLHFDLDAVPTNSDVVVILSQYSNCLEKLRADNILRGFERWYWVIEGEISGIPTAPPRKLKF